MKLSIITCTGDRGQCLKWCSDMMNAQTYQGEVEWLIIDDGAEITINNIDKPNGWVVDHYKLPPQDTPEMSICTNLLKGVRAATGDAIVFIEDDDWFDPRYLAHIVPKLERYAMVGQRFTPWYNVRDKCYKMAANLGSFLAFTSFRIMMREDFIAAIKECIRHESHKVDCTFWEATEHVERLSYYDGMYAVGIKGLHGRPGASESHKKNGGALTWVRPDPTGRVLGQLVGSEWANRYWMATHQVERVNSPSDGKGTVHMVGKEKSRGLPLIKPTRL